LNLVGKSNIKGVTRVIANHDSWDAFIKTYRLDAEVTSFKILKRWYGFICLGYWDETHSKKMPSYIWKDSCNQKGFCVPKVTLGTPMMYFTKAVGEFIASAAQDQEEVENNRDVPHKDDFPNIKGVTRVVANHDSWDAFIKTYRLDAEVTSFKIL